MEDEDVMRYFMNKANKCHDETKHKISEQLGKLEMPIKLAVQMAKRVAGKKEARRILEAVVCDLVMDHADNIDECLNIIQGCRDNFIGTDKEINKGN